MRYGRTQGLHEVGLLEIDLEVSRKNTRGAVTRPDDVGQLKSIHGDEVRCDCRSSIRLTERKTNPYGAIQMQLRPDVPATEATTPSIPEPIATALNVCPLTAVEPEQVTYAPDGMPEHVIPVV